MLLQAFLNGSVPYLPFMSDLGVFQKVYKFVNVKALKFSALNENHLFQCMGKIFCVEFQRFPLKLHIH